LDFGLWILDFTNRSGELMPKHRRRHDHFCVIAALENFQVGAAGERGFDADADFARLEGWRRDVFNLDFFLPVQDGGFHADSLRLRMAKAEEKFLILR
jgi:hypothetical protein